MIGVLALQGCVEPHLAHLQALGLRSRKVRSVEDLLDIAGLILPGGESTTILELLRVFHLLDPLYAQSREIPFWGVCAGAILMAKELVGDSRGPNQIGLGIIDFAVERNGYGRQLESFTDEIELIGGRREMATFIRAPRFATWADNIIVQGRYAGEAVFLESERHIVTAFHPELSTNLYFHRYFARKCGLLKE